MILRTQEPALQKRGLSRDTFTGEDKEGDGRTSGKSGNSKQSKSGSRSRTATSVPVPDEVLWVAALDDVVVDGSVSQQRDGTLESVKGPWNLGRKQSGKGPWNLGRKQSGKGP